MDYPRAPEAARRLSPDVYRKAAEILKCTEAAIRAVVEIEARGQGFDSGGRVLILNERHILYRRTSGEVRSKLVAAGLARQTPGGYPRTQDARYAWLDKARAIAGAKAFEAISMGLPQMMGFNARTCGYGSARLMYEAFARSADEQIFAMARFIAKNPAMHRAIQERDWPTFARHYNGPAYRKNRYDEKLANAYRKFSHGHKTEAVTLNPTILDIGDKGPFVKYLQEDLTVLGFPLDADGDFGPLTEEAVKAFQRKYGLKRDGIAGPKTLGAISQALQDRAVADDHPAPAQEELPSADIANATARPRPSEGAAGVLLAGVAAAAAYAAGWWDAAGQWVAGLFN